MHDWIVLCPWNLQSQLGSTNSKMKTREGMLIGLGQAIHDPEVGQLLWVILVNVEEPSLIATKHRHSTSRLAPLTLD